LNPKNFFTWFSGDGIAEYFVGSFCEDLCSVVGPISFPGNSLTIAEAFTVALLATFFGSSMAEQIGHFVRK